MSLNPHHLEHLAASGVTPEQAELRGYETVIDRARLADLGITRAGRGVPGLLVPMHRADGSVWGYQYRPDRPRERDGKTVKYETPTGQRNGIDVPPGVGEQLGDPTIPLWITEGVKKADCGAVHGLCVVALPGVWSWRGRNAKGGKVAVADWHDIALAGRRVILAFDGDVARKPAVRQALAALAGYLGSKGACVEYLHLPDGEKVGLDDYLLDRSTDDVWRLVHPEPPPIAAAPTVVTTVRSGAPDDSDESPPAVTLDEAHAVFRRWLGDEYDTDALDAVLAAAAVEQLDGDPLWLLLISGSGNAKTETVQSLDGIGATVTSTISSCGALLSATPKRERTDDATGGLLRKIGKRGVMVIKDVTSILSANADSRAEVLGALREVYDGRWSRNVGTDGGRTLDWEGRLAVVGAVTTAWDKAHAAVASMGDRFVLVRMDSTIGRQAAGRRAIGNTGSEAVMRRELAEAAAGVLAGVSTAVDLTTDETDLLLGAADLVTLARTGVEYDYRGDVIDAHAPEMPTRFAKQLAQVVRGAVAIGMDRTAALRLAIRCARDSMPPLRLAVIDDLAQHPDSTTAQVRKRVGKPRNTVDRQLQALHMLGVLVCDEQEDGPDSRIKWFYRLADGIEPGTLDPKVVPEKSVPIPRPQEEVSPGGRSALRVPTYISGPISVAGTGNVAAPRRADSWPTWHGNGPDPFEEYR